jgi:hypothetical protein
MDTELVIIEKFGLDEMNVEVGENWPSLRLINNTRSAAMRELLDELPEEDQVDLVRKRILQLRHPQIRNDRLLSHFERRWPVLLSEREPRRSLEKGVAVEMIREILTGLEDKHATQKLEIERKLITACNKWRRSGVTVMTEFFWERKQLLYRQELQLNNKILCSGISVHIGLTVGQSTLEWCDGQDQALVVDHLVKVIKRSHTTLTQIQGTIQY